MKNNFIQSGLSVKEIRKLALSRFEHNGSVRALTCYMLLKYNEDEQYVNLGINPLDYTCSQSFSRAYEATELLRKSNFLNLSWCPTDRARQAFLKSEEACRATNRRILTDFPTGRVNDILVLARKIISQWLPIVDQDLINKIVDEAGFGPGVTSSCKGIWLNAQNKFASKMQHTPALASLVVSLDKELPFGGFEYECIQGSQVSYVPKDARTDRPICIEPQLNGFLQKGVGSILRAVLLRAGCDLRDQGVNQRLAKEGSISNLLATVDLRSASDTISIECVRYLLPPDWFTLLSALRSSRYTEDGKEWKKFHKFSSMGNGFTFELESMIFLSLVRATRIVGKDTLPHSVYGDDIIISSALVGDLGEVMEFLGFSLNDEKSFSTGPFRESCGADFYLGDEVRPFYIKEATIVTGFNWANWLLYNSARLVNSRKTWSFIFAKTPERFRFRVPREGGLLGFEVDSYDAWISNTNLYRPVGLVFKPRKRAPADGVPSACASLLGIRRIPIPRPLVSSEPLGETARQAGRWKVQKAKVDTWPSCPWV